MGSEMCIRDRGDVVPSPITCQHHLGAPLAVQADIKVPIRILPLIHEVLEDQDQQRQANNPGREQHGTPDAGGGILGHSNKMADNRSREIGSDLG